MKSAISQLNSKIKWSSKCLILHTPTKRSIAHHLVEFEKQLLYEENQKCNSLWIPTPTFVVEIRARTVFSFGRFTLSRDKHVPVEFRYTYMFYTKSKSDKTRELSDLKLKPQTYECVDCCMTFPEF